MSLPVMRPGSRSSSRQSDRGVHGGSQRLGAGTPISASASSMRGMPMGATAMSMMAASGALPGALQGPTRGQLFADACAATAAYPPVRAAEQHPGAAPRHAGHRAAVRRASTGADVLWITVDAPQHERGAERMVASYDSRHPS